MPAPVSLLEGGKRVTYSICSRS